MNHAHLLCTDTEMDHEQVLVRCARLWPLERTFQDCKQQLLIENTQTQLPLSVRRFVPFGMLIYSLVVLWHLTEGHKLASAIRCTPDLWYLTTPRPSFRTMIAVLRRTSWAGPVLDPPSGAPSRQERLAEYIARVAAAA